MFAARSTCKTILLLLVVAALVGSSIPAMAQKGVWWWGSTKNYGITLINLTDHTLKLISSGIDCNNDCFPYPFEVLGVNVKPYSSAVWQTSTTTTLIVNYSGVMTFLPSGMEQKWAFNLNFRRQDASGAHLGKGTWVYLTAYDPTNAGWADSWTPTSYCFNFGACQMYLGYPTPLNTSTARNIMNLEGTGFAVSAYSPNNSHVVVVVQSIDPINEPQYQGWKLNFADNNDDSMPY